MVTVILISAAFFLVVIGGMLAIMSRRQKALPRGFDPPVVRPNSHGTARTNGEDD